MVPFLSMRYNPDAVIASPLSSCRKSHLPQRKLCTGVLIPTSPAPEHLWAASVSALLPVLDISCEWHLTIGAFLHLLIYFCLFLKSKIACFVI